MSCCYTFSVLTVKPNFTGLLLLDAGTYQEVFKASGFGKWHFLLLAQVRNMISKIGYLS